MDIAQIFGDLPTLETPRLILRRVTPDDAADQFEWTSDPLVTQYLTWGPQRSLEETRASIRFILGLYENKQVSPWGIVFKENGRQIGSCGYNWWFPKHGRAEISYMLSQKYWGMGLVTEAVAAIIRFGFEQMELNRIEALVHPDNMASRRVLDKVGLRLEGVLREAINLKGVYQDHMMYAILRRDWMEVSR